MDVQTVGVVAAAFADAAGASHALQRLRASQTRALVGFVDAAVLGRDECGRLALCDAARTYRRRGLMVLAATAGAGGLVAGPAQWEALGGDVVGELAGRLEATGFPGGRLRALGAGLLPGSSVLVALVQGDWAAPITGDLARRACGVVLEWLPGGAARELLDFGSLSYLRSGRGSGSGVAAYVEHVGVRARAAAVLRGGPTVGAGSSSAGAASPPAATIAA